MRKLLILALGIIAATFVKADMLYWQVNTSDYSGVEGASEYSYARILASPDYGATDKTALTSYLSDGSTEVGTKASKGLLDTTALYADLGGGSSPDYSTYQFVIELYGANDQAVANSGWMTYADLRAAKAIIDSQAGFNSTWTSMQALGSQGSWSKGAAAVPEPTSGLLVLIGAALVGLRRKKVA